MNYDVAIIGAGVTGAFIARELSRYDLKACLLEKEADVAMGTTKANSAIVHAGYDAKHGTLKSKLNVRGNQMMERISRELDVPFKKTGSLVLAFSEHDLATIKDLYENGLKNGVPGLRLLNAEEVIRLEPNVNPNILGALYAPSAGIVCPYELAIGAVENAVDNGVDLKLECEVRDIRCTGDIFELITGKGAIRSNYVVNASGLQADIISSMVQETEFSIRPRKGEYLLMDKTMGNMVNTVIFQPPTRMGKGILVTPTVDGNLLTGPTAEDVDDRDDVSTSPSGMRRIMEEAKKLVPNLGFRDVITSFAGLRAAPDTGDFVIEASRKVKGFINAAGIESPGLTAAPAIGEYVLELLKEQGLALKPKDNFNPIRKSIVHFRDLNDNDRNELIRKNPMYGSIVCRCETVTEGEIVDSIRRPAGAKNLDAVKRRTRAGMGRCQGGFCTPRVVDILSRELGIPPEEVTKKGLGSNILLGKRG
ncbi:MAG TPA: NAD(P)/FAD-dependent oxidoreductase [Clostridiales bacterium]|nr:NAD(P)/FAD-dependent oxidoreductase [Clostridiales bacterium]